MAGEEGMHPWVGARGWRRRSPTLASGVRGAASGGPGAPWAGCFARSIACLRGQTADGARLMRRSNVPVTAAGVLTVGALAVTVGAPAAPAAVWLLSWCFGSAALGRRASAGLPRTYMIRLWAMTSGLGALGLTAFGALGAGARSDASLARPEAGWLLLAVLAAVAVAALLLGGRRRSRREPTLLRWASRQRDVLGPALAAGAGMAGLLLSLADAGSPAPVLGLGVLAVIVLSGPIAVGALLRGMRSALQTGDAGPRTAARVRRLLLRFVAGYGVLAVPAALAGFATPILAGTAQASALAAIWLVVSVALVFGRGVATSMLLLAAGLAVGIGAPAGPTMAAAFMALSGVLLEVGTDVPRFGVTLLAGPRARGDGSSV